MGERRDTSRQGSEPEMRESLGCLLLFMDASEGRGDKMRFRDWLFGRRLKVGLDNQSSADTNEIRSKVRAVLAPLVWQETIDGDCTLSRITEILVNMADPQLEQDAVKMIAGVMGQLASEPRGEFFSAVGMALLVAYGPDHAKRLVEAIVQEHSHLGDAEMTKWRELDWLLNLEQNLVYVILEAAARRELESLLSESIPKHEQVEPGFLCKRLFSVRHSSLWSGSGVPDQIRSRFSSPKLMWSAMQDAALSRLSRQPTGESQGPMEKSRVRELLSENLTDLTIKELAADEEVIAEFWDRPLDCPFEPEQVRAYTAGLVLGCAELKRRLFELEVPRIRSEFESIKQGISDSLSVQPSFLVKRAATMLDRNRDSLIIEEAALGVYLLALTPMLFTKKGSFKLYRAVFDVPNQLAQMYIMRLFALSEDDLGGIYEMNSLDQFFGQGATSHLLNRSGAGVVTWATANSAGQTLEQGGLSMLALLYSLRYVARHYSETRHPEILAVTRAVLGHDQWNLRIIGSMPYERLMQEICQEAI